MNRTNRRSLAFTLVEMLVVIAIIAVLAALLTPAVSRALTSTRNAAIAFEVNQLASAVETYKNEKGDYPPNFRDASVVARHIRKCYPKIDPSYFAVFMTLIFPPDGLTNPAANAPVIDESESLVFWLSMTDTNPRFPFLSFPLYDPTTAVAATKTTKAVPPALFSATLPPSPKRYYDFDQTRLNKSVSGDVPSYNAKYCKDSFYIYIDSRSYDHPSTDLTDVCHFTAADGKSVPDTYAFADDAGKGVRPYWSDPVSSNLMPGMTMATTALNRDKFKPMNATSFQIICAGQDGEYTSSSTVDADVKSYPSGINYTPEDRDNITNFSGGKTLGDQVPP